MELRNGNVLVQGCCHRKSVVRKAVFEDPFQKADSWLILKTWEELRNLQESDPDKGLTLRHKEVGTVRPK